VSHALSDKLDGNHVVDVVCGKTLSFSKFSGVVLSVDARDRLCEGVLNIKFDVRCVLGGDSDRKIGVHGFSIGGYQDGIRRRTLSWRTGRWIRWCLFGWRRCRRRGWRRSW